MSGDRGPANFSRDGFAHVIGDDAFAHGAFVAENGAPHHPGGPVISLDRGPASV